MKKLITKLLTELLTAAAMILAVVALFIYLFAPSLKMEGEFKGKYSNIDSLNTVDLIHSYPIENVTFEIPKSKGKITQAVDTQKKEVSDRVYLEGSIYYEVESAYAGTAEEVIEGGEKPNRTRENSYVVKKTYTTKIYEDVDGTPQVCSDEVIAQLRGKYTIPENTEKLLVRVNFSYKEGRDGEKTPFDCECKIETRAGENFETVTFVADWDGSIYTYDDASFLTDKVSKYIEELNFLGRASKLNIEFGQKALWDEHAAYLIPILFICAGVVVFGVLALLAETKKKSIIHLCGGAVCFIVAAALMFLDRAFSVEGAAGTMVYAGVGGFTMAPVLGFVAAAVMIICLVVKVLDIDKKINEKGQEETAEPVEETVAEPVAEEAPQQA